MHHSRWLKYGCTETKLTTAGDAKAYLKSVVIPYSGNDCLVWPFRRDVQGYGRLLFRRQMQIASRVVCILVHGEPPIANLEAAHSCGNGSGGCVNPSHLSWKTRQENEADKRQPKSVEA